MKFAFADPPYLGQGRKRYGKHHAEASVWDTDVAHGVLIRTLTEQYDGWALSLSSPSLHDLLPMCPRSARIAAWVKPFAVFKPGVNPGYTWEPVIFVPSPRKRSRTEPTVRDWVSANITLKKGLCGAKPDAFCRWIIDLLGIEPADTLDDLYPGTGIMGRVWEQWKLEKAA